MNEIFQVISPAPYYLRDKNELYSRNPKTVAYGTESFSSVSQSMARLYRLPRIFLKYVTKFLNIES